MIQLRMLGRYEAVGADARPVAFRSRKVGALLAFLSLNGERQISNRTLQELLWPDSDGDRQAQSLRRAISDLRDALGTHAERGEVIRTEQGKTSLAEGVIESDVASFDNLLSVGSNEDGYDLKAAEAIAIYGGPLLAPFDDDWVYAYRRQYEERYCRAVSEFCRLLAIRGQAKEAARIANSAVILAPMREEPFVASIHAYAAMGNRSMALRQFEALEKMLDDHFGQTPSEAAQVALETDFTNLYGRPIEPTAGSGGAMDAESRFYVERRADQTAGEAIGRQEPVVLVFGPRQTGKTSLLARTTAKLRRQGAQIVVSDFQSLGKAEIERPATLYRALIHSFAGQLGLDYEPSWNEWVGANSNLDSHVDALLRQTFGPVCWAMDEVDRLFGTDYADDFFGLIRSWHNRRALDPEGPWKRLSLLISYATEAHLFIKDLNQSPFNVGLRVNLRDFDEDEVTDLASRYGTIYGAHSAEVFEITRGHPYLTRRAFAFLQSGKSVSDLKLLAPTEGGPFGDHLRQVRTSVQKDPTTAEEVKRLLRKEPLAHPDSRGRLAAAGIINDSREEPPSFRVPIYETALREGLA